MGTEREEACLGGGGGRSRGGGGGGGEEGWSDFSLEWMIVGERLGKIYAIPGLPELSSNLAEFVFFFFACALIYQN